MKINLETIRKVVTDNLVEESNKGNHTDFESGFKKMPIGKMFDQIQYLQNNVLPQAKLKLGEESESYQFYKSLVDSLMWGINAQSRFERLSERYSREKYMGAIMMKNRDDLERELMKYTTIEELYNNITFKQITS